MAKVDSNLLDRMIGLVGWIALNSTSSVTHEAQSIIDALPDSFFYTDADGRMVLKASIPK